LDDGVVELLSCDPKNEHFRSGKETVGTTKNVNVRDSLLPHKSGAVVAPAFHFRRIRIHDLNPYRINNVKLPDFKSGYGGTVTTDKKE
jgi:hypothetical protein